MSVKVATAPISKQHAFDSFEDSLLSQRGKITQSEPDQASESSDEETHSDSDLPPDSLHGEHDDISKWQRYLLIHFCVLSLDLTSILFSVRYQTCPQT